MATQATSIDAPESDQAKPTVTRALIDHVLGELAASDLARVARYSRTTLAGLGPTFVTVSVSIHGVPRDVFEGFPESPIYLPESETLYKHVKRGEVDLVLFSAA